MFLPTFYLRRYSLALSVFVLSACKKLVEAPLPENEFSMPTVFSSDAGAQAAMQGYYDALMNNQRGPVNGGIGLDAALSANEVICTPPFAAEDSFQIYKLSATNPENTKWFQALYNLIFQLNTMLEGLRASPGMSAPVRNQLEGEALFNRAFLYFYLVNLYGGVPLAMTTDANVNSALPRVSEDSVYSQVTADLEEAITYLPANYSEGMGTTGNHLHPDRPVAEALLARVWLYRRQWDSAESAATAVLGNGRYVLEPDPDSVFLSTSREAIWQLRPSYENWATAEGVGYLKQFPAGRPSFALTPELSGGLDSGDLRGRWMDSVLYRGKVLWYPYKYKLTVDTGAAMEYEIVIRLAELYLIRAEARAQRGELDGAIADVDVIRARAGLAGTTAVTQADLLDAIFRERRVELFCEWGHRWLDLKRTGQADLVLHTRAGWELHDLLYPIPQAELLLDPNVHQNPGY